MRIAAIVLAAGEGRRMGGPKALLKRGEDTFLALLCARLASAGLDPVLAVIGAEAERVRRGAGLPESVQVVVNAGWRDGMLSSLLQGLDAAERAGAAAVLAHPVDNPDVTAGTIASVLDALRRGARVVVPSHAGRRGHPAGFAGEAIAALRHADPSRGARSVLAEHPDWVVHVPAGPDCLVDLDTPEDLHGGS